MLHGRNAFSRGSGPRKEARRMAALILVGTRSPPVRPRARCPHWRSRKISCQRFHAGPSDAGSPPHASERSVCQTSFSFGWPPDPPMELGTNLGWPTAWMTSSSKQTRRIKPISAETHQWRRPLREVVLCASEPDRENVLDRMAPCMALQRHHLAEI